MAYTFSKKIIGLDFRGISFGAVTYATWNPADKGGGVTLSNGNLTATATQAGGAVRSTIGKTSGKWYWEVVAGDTFENIGILQFNGNIDVELGSTASGYSYRGSSSSLRNDGANYASVDSYTTNDNIGIALDMDNHTLQFYKNNMAEGPAKAIGSSAQHAAFSAVPGGGTQSCTANFGATALTYAPPLGFNAGLYI